MDSSAVKYLFGLIILLVGAVRYFQIKASKVELSDKQIKLQQEAGELQKRIDADKAKLKQDSPEKSPEDIEKYWNK